MTESTFGKTLAAIALAAVVPTAAFLLPVWAAEPESAPDIAEPFDDGLLPELGSPREAEPGELRVATDPRDSIDASAPHDQDLAKLLQRAEALLQKGNWEWAQKVLLSAIDQADGAVVRRTDGSIVPAAVEANRLLGRLPSDVLDLYRKQYGGAADEALAEAVRSGRRDLIEQVATQFRQTTAGRSAVERLAAIHFDHGEFGLAARRYQELLDGGVPISPRLRIRAATAFLRSGNDERARDLIAELTEKERADLAQVPASNDRPNLFPTADPSPSAPTIEDWRMPFGDPARASVGTPGEPLLVRRWHRPLTDRQNVRDRAAQTTSDLRDAGRATIPAALPLAIGDQVIARTFRGVDVYSAADGRLLWETTEGLSPERVLSGEAGSAEQPAAQQLFRFRRQFGPLPSQREVGDQDGMTNLLYRDGVTGLISADAHRLYAVEESVFPESPTGIGWDDQEADSLGRDRSANRLVAYDLTTGRPAWRKQGGVGGGAAGVPSERPLAGYFFFGPPTPVGDDLYVIGERDKEIRLLALDPATGDLRHDCLLAHAPVGIGGDPVRRWWPAQIAAADGVLVCPTTVGWLLGIDRASLNILWAHRYAPVQAGNANAGENGLAAPAAVLNSRWSPSAPIISGGKVLFSPSEEARLVCLDLYTGEPLWRQGKGSGLYVAGVSHGALITVGTTAVAALDLETGTSKWSLRLDGAAPPTGRAALTTDRLYLPLPGLLRAIDPTTGTTVADLPLPDDGTSLGNLLLHRGTLLSYSADGLTAFEERTGLAKSIEDRLQVDPADPVALLRRAELQAADGNATAAASTLDRIEPSQATPEVAERLHTLRRRILSDLVRAGGKDTDARLRQLAELAETSDDRLTIRRLEAERAFAAGALDQAAAACLSMLDAGPSDRLLEIDAETSVRVDAWLAGRFTDLWTRSDETGRLGLTREIQARFASARIDDDRARLVRIFEFHPEASAVARSLATADLNAGRLAQAEIRLRPFARRDDPAGIQARLDLAALAIQAELPSDAAAWLAEAALFEGETLLPSGKRLAEELKSFRTKLESSAAPNDPWADFRLAVVRSGAYTAAETTAELRPQAAGRPLSSLFRNRQFRLHLQQDRLSVSGVGGGGLDRLVPLRVGPRNGSQAVATADGHLLFLLYRNVVQLVSPTEGRVLWSFPVADDAAGLAASSDPPQPMRPAGSVAVSNGLIARSRAEAQMPAANANYVLLRGRRELTLLDSATGTVRWKRTGLPQDATVIGTDSCVYILASDQNESAALRAIDGKPLDRLGAIERLPYAVAAVGDRFLTVTAEQSFSLFNLRLGRSVVSLFDPESGSPVWSRAFPQDALFDRTPDGRLCVLDPDGTLSAVDPQTGQPSPLGRAPAEILQRRNEAYLFTDAASVFLVVNSGRAAASYYPADIPAIAVHGEIFAFAPDASLKWRRPVQNRRLLCQEFGHMPVLLFADSEMTEKGNRTFWRVDLLALDKRTGEPVLDEPYHSQSTPFFRGLTVRPDRRSIELGAYPIRLRLQAVPKPSGTAEDAPASPPSG